MSLIPRYSKNCDSSRSFSHLNTFGEKPIVRKIEIEVESGIQFMLERSSYSICSLLVSYQQDFRLGKLRKWRHPDWNTKHGDASYDGVSSCPLPFFLGRAYHRSTATDNEDFYPVVDRGDRM